MKAHYKWSVAVGTALGAVAVQGLRAQAPPPVDGEVPVEQGQGATIWPIDDMTDILSPSQRRNDA
jgi:hypothetical protein